MNEFFSQAIGNRNGAIGERAEDWQAEVRQEAQEFGRPFSEAMIGRYHADVRPRQRFR